MKNLRAWLRLTKLTKNQREAVVDRMTKTIRIEMSVNKWSPTESRLSVWPFDHSTTCEIVRICKDVTGKN